MNFLIQIFVQKFIRSLYDIYFASVAQPNCACVFNNASSQLDEMFVCLFIYRQRLLSNLFMFQRPHLTRHVCMVVRH